MDGTRLGQLASSVGIGGLDAMEAMKIFQFANLVAEEAATDERAACIAAVEDERLTEPTTNDGDAAYNTAIAHAVKAMRTRSNAPAKGSETA